MARLGEHLVAARLLDQDQIQRALRAQVLWGGRLGTNLIELGFLDLDGISRALGRQHKVPAALARHFEKADRELQERLPLELAHQWSAVPLLHVGPQKQIAIAVLDPLPPEAIAQLAEAFLCDASTILQSIAAEMRVRYHLERVYGIPRDTRFLRLKGQNATPFPQFDNVPVPVDSDAEVAVPIAVDDSEHPTGRASANELEAIVPAVPLAAEQAAAVMEVERAPTVAAIAPPIADLEGLEKLIDEAIAQVAAIEPEPPREPSGRDRRTYVRTLADSPLTPAPASVVTGTLPTPALARMAIKKVPMPPRDPAKPMRTAAKSSPPGSPQSLGEATRAIRRANNRDRVAELVIDTLEQFVPVCEAAVLLVRRGAVAVSWKQFSHTCDTSAEIAVPLDQAGLVPTVIANNAVARCAVAKLTAIDERLMRSLGELRGDLVVVPIAIANSVVAVIATTTEARASVDYVEAVALAAAGTFARLIRDASR
jgi:hypothetical protein